MKYLYFYNGDTQIVNVANLRYSINKEKDQNKMLTSFPPQYPDIYRVYLYFGENRFKLFEEESYKKCINLLGTFEGVIASFEYNTLIDLSEVYEIMNYGSNKYEEPC